MSVAWVVVILAAIVVEGATVQLVSIWFALGAAVALVLSIFDVNIAIQVVTFIVVSAIAIAAFWPVAKKMRNRGHQKLNADRFVGKTAVVIEEISNINAAGTVKVDNQIWTARSVSDTIIPKDALVKVEKIEGVKLIVSEMSEAE